MQSVSSQCCRIEGGAYEKRKVAVASHVAAQMIGNSNADAERSAIASRVVSHFPPYSVCRTAIMVTTERKSQVVVDRFLISASVCLPLLVTLQRCRLS